MTLAGGVSVNKCLLSTPQTNRFSQPNSNLIAEKADTGHAWGTWSDGMRSLETYTMYVICRLINLIYEVNTNVYERTNRTFKTNKYLKTLPTGFYPSTIDFTNK